MFNLKPWPLLEQVVCEDPFRSGGSSCKPLQTNLELRKLMIVKGLTLKMT